MFRPTHLTFPIIKSANPVDFDNFEFMADELLNKLATISLPDMDIAETDQPDDPTVYYARAREATETRIFSEGFSKYWHLGGGPDWNGDGPQGHHSYQTTNEDIFPKLYSDMSQQETDFLFGQLSEGVRYVGLFLLAVDRISQYRVTVGKKRINKGDGLVYRAMMKPSVAEPYALECITPIPPLPSGQLPHRALSSRDGHRPC